MLKTIFNLIFFYSHFIKINVIDLKQIIKNMKYMYHS